MVNISRDDDVPEDIWAAQEDMRLFSDELSDKSGKARECCRAAGWAGWFGSCSRLPLVQRNSHVFLKRPWSLRS